MRKRARDEKPAPLTREMPDQQTLSLRENYHPQVNTMRSNPAFFTGTDSYNIVDLAMRGEEANVLGMIEDDYSQLLPKLSVKNYAGVEYRLTPVQAAIMTNDVQLLEKITPYFECLPGEYNGALELHNQIKEIYQMSLSQYVAILSEKIDFLKGQQLERRQILVPNIISLTEDCLRECREAMEGDDLPHMASAHSKAQENNIFRDIHTYIYAIRSASPIQLEDAYELIRVSEKGTSGEIAAVIARTGVAPTQANEARTKPFELLTLVEKLNRFREEFRAHQQREIIFNPNHILEGLRLHECVYRDLEQALILKSAGRASEKYTQYCLKVRSLILSQIPGWMQREGSEAIREDLRQGTFYLTHGNQAVRETRKRQEKFNNQKKNNVDDITLANPSVIGGWGYTFAAARCEIMEHMPHGAAGSQEFHALCQERARNLQAFLRSLVAREAQAELPDSTRSLR